MAYNPADFELVEAPAGSASPYNPADFELVEAPEGSGFWRQAADLPVSAAGGVITGLKGMTDLFGANNPVSQELASYQEFYRQSLSPEAQADQQEVARIMQEAQDKGVWEQVKAGARAFAVAPLDTAAQSLGTMAPIVATGVAGRALGLGAKGVQAVQAGAGAGMNTGIVKDSIYQDTKNFLLQSGKSEEEADRVALEAQSYGGQNIDQLLLAAGLGAADALFGAEKILGNAISKSGGRVTGGVVAGAVKTGVSEGIPEAAQGGQEAMAPNIALQREGYAVPTMRGVASSATMEGLSGFMAGAPVGAAEGMAAPMDDRSAPTMSVGPDAPPFTPPPAAETVVVEEVFGDATTAAAPAAEPAINPDDFEVVEMPGETIVTEPPAAPAFQFDLADDTATAPEADAGADVFSGVRRKADIDLEAEIPLGLSRPQTADPSLRDLDDDAFDKLYNERRDAIIKMEKMIDDAEDPDSILLNREKRQEYANLGNQYRQAELERYRRNQTLVASGSLFEDMLNLSEGQDRPGWANTEEGQKFSILAEIIASRPQDQRDDAALVDSLMVLPDRIKADPNFQEVTSWKMQRTREAMQKVMAQRPTAQPAPSPQLPAVQPAAATVRQPKAPKDPATMTASQINKELDAISEKQGNLTTEFIEAGRGNETPSEYLKKDDPLAARARELFSRASDLRSEVRMRAGPDMSRLPSGRGFGPRVAAESSPAQRSRRRIKNMTAQSGAIDLSIVEDLFEYGKTIYRAGMSFGKWAGQMVKEFGQGIASFLKQVFDRIVQAYKDSPYSDTTGAVGNVRPKAKPRQFEQKAAQAPGLSEETRAQMGNDPYVPITLRGVAEDAKAWLGENGVEAAERRILELNSDEVTPSPLDFAIGLELTANLSATGQHTRAAAIVRTMSRRATSLGQTISTLAMLSRLTPEGIIFYANQTIEQYIGSLPPERQQQIRTAQDGIRQLETDIATTRKRTAEDAIIKGEQGGEKIQDKLKRRIPDKGQKQQANVSIRSVLTSQATKTEATKQITQILVDSGISQSEATALATAITNRFYKVLEDARKAAAANRRPASGKGRVTFDKLMAQLKDGKISDQDFIGALAQLVNVPALTPELRTKLDTLTRQYKAATDDDIAMVTAARIFEEVHGLVPVDFWVKLRAVSYLSMLFAPKTWIRNLGGNQIQWLTDIGIDGAISMVFDPVASIFTGKRTTAGLYVGTRIKALLTPIQDVVKGYKWNAQQNPSANFMENLKAGVEHLRVLAKLTTQNKFDIVDAKEVGRRIFSNKFMQMWEGALSIALGGGDRAFWMSGFRASLARREAAAKKNGEWTGQPTPEDVEAAYADAMYAIYQNPNVISKGSNKIRQALNFISTFGKTTQFGLGTRLIAFTQVPGSISLRGIIELSPLGLVSGLYEAMRPVLFKVSGARAGGQFRQEDFNKAMARAMVGSGVFYAGGYWLYSMGIITASREEDDDLEAMRRATGMGAYRINVTALKRMLGSGNFFERQTTQETDFIVPYDWAQPVAITFAAGAELAKMVEENNREGVKKGLAGKAGMAAISLAAGAKSLEELPLLSGLSSFMKDWAYSGPLDAVVNSIAGLPSMFVPQLVRQANQLMDNTVRESRAGEGAIRAFNQIAANTPGVSDQFPPRFDIMGQAIERYQYGGNSLFNVLINPAMTTRVRTSPVLNEVARLMETTGETRQMPRQVKRSANINGESIQLSNEQISAYQYYLGNYTMSMMNWRMASPRYARLPDTEKVRIFAQDIEDVDAAVKSALFGHDIRRLTRRQRSMRNNLVNSPLGQSMPPR
jgi:hypothetical protein